MATGRVYEQIPHPKIAYAYLAIEAETWNEFENLRAETLKKHPLYAESVFEKKSAPVGNQSAPVAAADAEVGGSELPSGSPPASVESAPASAPTSTEGLSPREKAKLKMAAKKEAANG